VASKIISYLLTTSELKVKKKQWLQFLLSDSILLCSFTPAVNEGRECLAGVSVQRLWPENNKLQSLLNL